MILLERKLLNQMKQDAESRYPKECCGILLGRREGMEKRLAEEVYQTPNDAKQGQERQFQIDPFTLLKAEQYAAENGMEIIGFYHSHPDCKAIASKEDEQYAMPAFSYPILSVLQGEVQDMQSWVRMEDGFCQETIQYL